MTSRTLWVGLLGVCAGACAQIPPGLRVPPGGPGGPPLQKPSAAIPATAPTVVAPLASPLQQFVPAARPVAAVRRARVDYSNGLVTVTANNSSLNQILRDIARATGMTISGGVTDERVFGTYGPGTLTDVLQPLLNGTGSNMMLIESVDQAPEHLMLTPRQGGASPPSPMAGQDAPDDDMPPQLTPRTSNVPTLASPQGGIPSPGPAPVPSQNSAPEVPAPAAAVTTTTEQSPNGVKTPQQIYDELMKMQQQTKKMPQ